MYTDRDSTRIRTLTASELRVVQGGHGDGHEHDPDKGKGKGHGK